MTRPYEPTDVFEDAEDAGEHFGDIAQHIQDSHESLTAAINALEDSRAINWARLTDFNFGSDLQQAMTHQKALLEAAKLLLDRARAMPRIIDLLNDCA